MSYGDDFDPHPPPAYAPPTAEWLSRPRWPRRLSLVLTGLLAVLYACS